jgi:hypothetical protein
VATVRLDIRIDISSWACSKLRGLALGVDDVSAGGLDGGEGIGFRFWALIDIEHIKVNPIAARTTPMRAESFKFSGLISNLLNVSVIAAQYKSKMPANQQRFNILILEFPLAIRHQ